MVSPINFSQKYSDASGNYTIEIADSEIELSCYLLGSPTGGTGTECFHTIGLSKVSEFLAALGLSTLADIPGKLSNYNSVEWRTFHLLVIKSQTDSFVWHETNWDD